MELPIHVELPTRPALARWIPSVRAVALLGLGVGIGVLAALPHGGTATPVVVAVVAATVASGLVILSPRSVALIAVADVLLGIAAMASVLGGLGVLYVPIVIAFFAVTARLEQPGRHAGAGVRWRPAPEIERMNRPSVAGPARVPPEVWLPPFEPHVVRAAEATLGPLDTAAWLPPDSAERPTWLAGNSPASATLDDPDAAEADESADDVPVGITANGIESELWLDVTAPPEPGTAHQTGPAGLAAMRAVATPQDVPAPAVPAAVTAPAASDRREARRNRTLPSARRMVSAAARARRLVGAHARIGFQNLRAALSDAPLSDIDVSPRIEDDTKAGVLPAGDLVVLPPSELIELRREIADLEGVGPGRTPSAGTPRSRLLSHGRAPRTHRSNPR